MQIISKLFGKSPFSPLQKHMEKVAACVFEITSLIDALKQKDYQKMQEIAAKISKLEHEADLTKNDIRNHLPTGLFLPIARGNLLEILSIQDNIADSAEDAALLMTLRDLEIEPVFEKEFFSFLEKNLEAVKDVFKIIEEMESLLESSFGGNEAVKVKSMVSDVALKEHDADILQAQLLKIFFRKMDKMPTPLFYLWMQIFKVLGRLSDESEKLANRVRMILEVQ